MLQTLCCYSPDHCWSVEMIEAQSPLLARGSLVLWWGLRRMLHCQISSVYPQEQSPHLQTQSLEQHCNWSVRVLCPNNSCTVHEQDTKMQTKLCRLCVLCVSRTEMWTRICVLCVCRTRKYLQSILRFPSTKSLYSWSEGCGSDSWSSSIASWDDGLSSLEIRLLLGTWDDDASASKHLCQLKSFQGQHKHQETHRIQTGHAQQPLASSTQTAQQTL